MDFPVNPYAARPGVSSAPLTRGLSGPQERTIVAIDTKNPPSKWWYAVAVIGTLIVLGGCGLGTVALVHSYQPFTFPPELDWLKSFIGTIGNTPGFWGPWVLTGGSAVVGSLFLGSSIHQVGQIGGVSYRKWLHGDFSQGHTLEEYRKFVPEGHFVVLPAGSRQRPHDQFIPHPDGSGMIVVHEKNKNPQRTDKHTKDELAQLAAYLQSEGLTSITVEQIKGK